MPVVRFIEANGFEHIVEAPVGGSLKNAALDNLVPGIIGDCGGFMECGTCHGYVDQAFVAALPAPNAAESSMLDGLAGTRRSTSRLTCQLTMTPELDGIVLQLPEEQG